MRTNKTRQAKRRMKYRDVRALLLETMKEMICTIKHTIIEELDKIALVLQIMIPVVLAGLELHEMIICSCFLLFVVKYLKEINYKLNKTTDRGFPLPMESFIERDENGFISLVEGKEHEAILYLDDIENYLKSKGLLK